MGPKDFIGILKNYIKIYYTFYENGYQVQTAKKVGKFKTFIYWANI